MSDLQYAGLLLLVGGAAFVAGLLAWRVMRAASRASMEEVLDERGLGRKRIQ